MGFRFRKSVKIAPGIRLNASKRGLGVSLGGRAGGLSIGPSGVRARASLPGSCISYGEKIDGGRRRSHNSAPARRSETVEVKVRIHVDEETGEVSDTDQHGRPLAPAIECEAKRLSKDELGDLLEETAAKINAEVESLTRLHLETPDPRVPLRFTPTPFDDSRPKPPQDLPGRGLLGFLMPPIGARREQQAQRLREDFETEKARVETRAG